MTKLRNASTTRFSQLRRLSQLHGDAFYLVDTARFAENWRSFTAAFRAVYPASQPAYSYKTNYLPAFCRLVDEQGGWAEVVSGLEYKIARRLNIAPERIVFNGPYKTEAELQTALAAGSTVNIDHADELKTVLKLADGSSPSRVGMRINLMDADLGPSRFGFSLQSAATAEAIDCLQRHPAIDFCGYHAHYCPRVRSAENYAHLTKQLIAFARQHEDGSPPDILNLGGGFFSPMPDELKRRWDYPVPDFDDYAAAIGGEFIKAYGTSGPTLMLEPGMAVVADAQQFVCRVVGTKTIGQQHYGLLSGSVYNIKPSKNTANLPLEIFGVHDACSSGTSWVLTGYTCMEDDIMHTQSPPVKTGDFAVFHNVGAYTNVLIPPFIQAAPAILEYCNDSVRPLRVAQSAADILRGYELE